MLINQQLRRGSLPGSPRLWGAPTNTVGGQGRTVVG